MWSTPPSTAGGDVDACLTAVVPHGEAQLRRGAQGLKNAHMNAVGGADLRGGVGKLRAVVAAQKQAETGDPGDANALTPNYLRLSQAERERAERMKSEELK